MWEPTSFPTALENREATVNATPMPGARSLAFFAHERGDARVVKRITALQDQGWQVTGFTFHRVRDKADSPPSWDNIPLGTTYNRRYVQRLWAIAGAMIILWKNRQRLADCRVIYAINTDNAVLALLAGLLGGRRAPLVLELADIQPAMTGRGLLPWALKFIERKVLRRCALLVTTSPGFIRNYFEPVQHYRGEIFLLENKIYPSANLPSLPTNEHPVANGRPWVIGCFGALRCRRSLEIMHALASTLGDKIRIELRGYPAGTIADDFFKLLGDLPNLHFGGPYLYPDDLAKMYSAIDFNWAFDDSDPNGNSAWLLPNRIYEGGCFGVPVIGAKKTETGRWIEEQQLGWTFGEPLEKNLTEFFKTLSVADWQSVKARCSAAPRENFTADADYHRLSTKLAAM